MATLLKVTRTMRDLLVNGVSMVNALKLTSRVAGNNRIRRKLDEIRAAVEEGRSFSKSLAGDNVFPETMVWKLQMGEEKGIVEDALSEVVDVILQKAVLTGASDVHIEPHKAGIRTRYRIDGIFHELGFVPMKIHDQVVARVKVLADLISHKREVSQEGRITINAGAKQ